MHATSTANVDVDRKKRAWTFSCRDRGYCHKVIFERVLPAIEPVQRPPSISLSPLTTGFFFGVLDVTKTEDRTSRSHLGIVERLCYSVYVAVKALTKYLVLEYVWKELPRWRLNEARLRARTRTLGITCGKYLRSGAGCTH